MSDPTRAEAIEAAAEREAFTVAAVRYGEADHAYWTTPVTDETQEAKDRFEHEFVAAYGAYRKAIAATDGVGEETDCETCQDTGEVDETLGGESHNDRHAPCPDCTRTAYEQGDGDE